jgi:hypothetical protein
MVEGERRLWRAVLDQAYEDAEMWAVGDDAGPKSPERNHARRYLRADSRFEVADFKLVCEFADIPADRVISWARKRYSLAA